MKTYKRYTNYKRYEIVTEAAEGSEGGWSVNVRIIKPDGRPVVSGVNAGVEGVFATEMLAHRAGVALARYWIDANGSAVEER